MVLHVIVIYKALHGNLPGSSWYTRVLYDAN